jgi:catechol 2,3-dioxygenase-like lactoylglutathione lyase family enzyme
MNIQLPHFQRLLQLSSLKPKKKPHINPRYRAYGRARIDIIQHVSDQQDWDRLWKSPSNTFPFLWTKGWKQCIEYRVDDYAAEVGFYIDFLGFPVDEFGPQYARLTSPTGDFYIGVEACPEGQAATPVTGFRLQFLITDVFELVEELQKRGVAFELPPRPQSRDKSMVAAAFKTPHGITVELIGENRVPELEIPQNLSISKDEPVYNGEIQSETGAPDPE